MVHGFDDVIAVDDFVAAAENRMGVEQVYGMLMAELAAFDTVAVVLPDSFFAEQRMNDFLSAHQYVEIGQTGDGWATVWSSQ